MMQIISGLGCLLSGIWQMPAAILQKYDNKF